MCIYLFTTFPLLVLVIITNLPYCQSITLSEVRGFGRLDIHSDYRLESEQARELTTDVALDVDNVHQCVRMCWRYTSCRAVTYSSKSKPSCRLVSGVSGDPNSSPLAMEADAHSVVVDMKDAVVQKKKLFGCDKRPCQPNQLCVTRSDTDTFSCLSQGVTVCGEPSPRIENASVSTDGMSDLYYRCLDGFAPSPEGVVKATCNTDTGQWSSVTLSCRFVGCGIPPDLSGATVRYTDTNYNSMSKYLCKTGYYSPSEGNMDTVCQESGTWSAMPSSCQPVDCGQPAPLDNGQVSLPVLVDETGNPSNSTEDLRTFYGGEATHSCVEGHTSPIAAFQSFCQSSGQWSSPPVDFQCKPVDCGNPLALGYAVTMYNSTSYLSHVNYSCIDGYQSPSPLTDRRTDQSVCLHNGNWSDINLTCLPVDCGTPLDLPTGVAMDANETTFGSIASLKCFNDSHLFRGDNQLTCNVSGLWSETNASCSSVQPCVTPPTLVNATMTVKMADDDDDDYGFIVVYQSMPGFKFDTGNTSETFTCIDGSWDRSPDGLVSLPVDCGTPPNIPYANTTGTGHSYGSVTTYTCNEGFENTTVTNQIMCLENGSWSRKEFACRRMNCSAPPLIDHSRNTVDMSLEYVYGDRVVYECEDGYFMKTLEDSMVCGESGWNNTGIECAWNECGPPPTVHNSTFVMHAESVLYSCDEGFDLVDGNVSRKTCRGGRWSEEEVTCVLDGCPLPPEVENATSVYNSSVVTYTCKEGYRFAAEDLNQRVCQQNWKWSSENVTCQLIRCGTPPSLVNTETTSTGATVEYTCKAGYKVQGSSGTTTFGSVVNDSPPVFMPGNDIQAVNVPDIDVIWTTECNGSGEWTSNTARPAGCDPLNCGDPPSVADAALTQSPANTTFGSSVQYSCLTGFSLVSADNNSKTCGESGMWEGDVECASIRCPDYESVTDATVTKDEGRKPGDVVIYGCKWDRDHWWFDRKMCLDNGTWSAPRIECRIVDCGTPPDVEFATVSYTTTTVQSYARYDCLDGYARTHGVKTKDCLPEGKWGSFYLQCKKRGEPSCSTIRKDNSYVGIRYTNLTENALALFHCKDGSYLRVKNTTPIAPAGYDKHSLVCTSGRWVGERHTCEPMDCGSYPSVTNADASGSGSTYKSQVSYHCRSGYAMPGPTSKTCLADGRWSDEAVECIREDLVHCSPPPTTNHVTIEYTSHTVGSTAVYTCIEGFINNTKHVECLPSGLWSDLGHFKCVPVNCQSPPEMAHTTIHVRETSYGHHAIYTCSVYGQDDDRRPSRSQCLANGQWSSVDSPCFHCGTPPHPSHTANLTQTTNHLYDIGETVSYTCSDDYTLIPPGSNLQMTCGQGGEWSDGDSTSGCFPLVCMEDRLDNNTEVVSIDIHKDLSQIELRFICKEGSQPQRQEHTNRTHGVAMCNIEDGWTFVEMMECAPVKCGPVPAIANASFSDDGTGHQYLSTVVYSCDPTFLVKGSEVVSVCGHDGMWTPANLTCVQCDPRETVQHGHLIEKISEPRSLREQPVQKAVLECDVEYLLYRTGGPVYSGLSVTCEMGSDGNQYWKGLEELACSRRVWNTPKTTEAIRLDGSYPSYNICLSLAIVDQYISIRLRTLNILEFEEPKEGVAFAVILVKMANKVDFLQTNFKGESKFQNNNFQFEDRLVHLICIEAFSDTYGYRLTVDGTFVGDMNDFAVPFDFINEFIVQGFSGDLNKLVISV